MNFDSFPTPETKTPEKNQDEPKRSRIAWRSKLTGATGHGEFIPEGEKIGGETIEEHLKGATERNPDLEHWLESEEPSSEPRERNGLESLEGDEKGFAEFIEKRLQHDVDMGPLLDIVRSGMISPEVKERIFEDLNFFSKIEYERFASIDSDRRAKIETDIIEKFRNVTSR